MDKNAKFALVAVAVLALSAFGVFAFYKVEANSVEGATQPTVKTIENTQSVPLKIGEWNEIRAPWQIDAIKMISVRIDDKIISIEQAQKQGIIGTKVFLSGDEDRMLGLENEILAGRWMNLFVNKTGYRNLTLILTR